VDARSGAGPPRLTRRAPGAGQEGVRRGVGGLPGDVEALMKPPGAGQAALTDTRRDPAPQADQRNAYEGKAADHSMDWIFPEWTFMAYLTGAFKPKGCAAGSFAGCPEPTALGVVDGIRAIGARSDDRRPGPGVLTAAGDTGRRSAGRESVGMPATTRRRRNDRSPITRPGATPSRRRRSGARRAPLARPDRSRGRGRSRARSGSIERRPHLASLAIRERSLTRHDTADPMEEAGRGPSRGEVSSPATSR
jgi:hypothetical protein